MTGRSLALALAAGLLALSACLGMDRRRDYRREMRRFVAGLSSYAKTRQPGFRVLAHNALPLLTDDGTPEGRPAEAYLRALDGALQESLFYSHDRGRTDPAWTQSLCRFLDLAKARGLAALALDYPSTPEQAEDSRRRCRAKGYLCFQGSRELARLPQTPLGNGDFLYLLNPGGFKDRRGYLEALRRAGGEVLVVDLFYGPDALSREEVDSLRVRPEGGRRLVLAYLSVGEAADYRYYWKPEFSASPPSWLEAPNPDWPGDHKVRYWDRGWQALVYGSPDSYLDRILAAGFDGAALDVVDAYDHFEARAAAAR